MLFLPANRSPLARMGSAVRPGAGTSHSRGADTCYWTAERSNSVTNLN